MGYIRKSLTNVLAAGIAATALVAVAIWQLYLFATFKDAKGIFDVQGGVNHLGWAFGTALLACLTSFFLFTVFGRYDKANEIHVTS